MAQSRIIKSGRIKKEVLNLNAGQFYNGRRSYKD